MSRLSWRASAMCAYSLAPNNSRWARTAAGIAGVQQRHAQRDARVLLAFAQERDGFILDHGKLRLLSLRNQAGR